MKKRTIFLPVETQMTITPDAFALGTLTYRLQPGAEPIFASAVAASTPIVIGPLDVAREYTLELSSGEATVVKAFAGSPTAAEGNEFTDAEKTKLAGIEALADVTDEANVVSALDGATLTSATVAATDKVLVQDADDADNLKTVTAQSIADLASGGGGGGSWVHLSTQTASASTSLNFESLITSTYDQYMIVIDRLLGSGTVGSHCYLNTSTDNGVSYANASGNYNTSANLFSFAAPTTITTFQSVGSDDIELLGIVNMEAGSEVSGTIYLLNPLSTEDTWMYWTLVEQEKTGYRIDGSARRNNEAADNAFRIHTPAGNFVSGTVRLYGLAKS